MSKQPIDKQRARVMAEIRQHLPNDKRGNVYVFKVMYELADGRTTREAVQQAAKRVGVIA